MKIHAISDTHRRHKEFTMPGGDVLVCSGDICSRGSLEEAIDFLNWFGAQPYDYKVLVPGNHDWVFEHNPELMKAECFTRNIILLNDSGVTINGVKFWGSPVQPRFFNWAFNRDRGPDIQRHWDLIPIDTDVLITHGPPAGILDYVPGPRGGSVGCHDLARTIVKTNIKLHIFGHIHYSRGHSKVGNCLYINAASVSEQYLAVSGVPMRIKMNKDGSFRFVERRKKHEPKQED